MKAIIKIFALAAAFAAASFAAEPAATPAATPATAVQNNSLVFGQIIQNKKAPHTAKIRLISNEFKNIFIEIKSIDGAKKYSYVASKQSIEDGFLKIFGLFEGKNLITISAGYCPQFSCETLEAKYELNVPQSPGFLQPKSSSQSKNFYLFSSDGGQLIFDDLGNLRGQLAYGGRAIGQLANGNLLLFDDGGSSDGSSDDGSSDGDENAAKKLVNINLLGEKLSQIYLPPSTLALALGQKRLYFAQNECGDLGCDLRVQTRDLAGNSEFAFSLLPLLGAASKNTTITAMVRENDGLIFALKGELNAVIKTSFSGQLLWIYGAKSGWGKASSRKLLRMQDENYQRLLCGELECINPANKESFRFGANFDDIEVLAHKNGLLYLAVIDSSEGGFLRVIEIDERRLSARLIYQSLPHEKALARAGLSEQTSQLAALLGGEFVAQKINLQAVLAEKKSAGSSIDFEVDFSAAKKNLAPAKTRFALAAPVFGVQIISNCYEQSLLAK